MVWTKRRSSLPAGTGNQAFSSNAGGPQISLEFGVLSSNSRAETRNSKLLWQCPTTSIGACFGRVNRELGCFRDSSRPSSFRFWLGFWLSCWAPFRARCARRRFHRCDGFRPSTLSSFATCLCSSGWFALGVYHGARFSEVMRSGIQSIPKTQFEAALSTGLTVPQAYRLIIIPIAVRLIIPPITNESLNLLKNSSVALTIGVAELTFQTRQIETYTAKAFEALTAGTLIYLMLCLAIAAIMAWVERRVAIPGMIAQNRAGEF